MKCKTCGCELETYDLLDYRCWHGCNDYPMLLKVSVSIQAILFFLLLIFAGILLGLISIGEKVGLVKLILRLKGNGV